MDNAGVFTLAALQIAAPMPLSRLSPILSLDGMNAVTAAPTVTATKTDGVTIAKPGDTLSYSLTLGNAGTGDANGLALTQQRHAQGRSCVAQLVSLWELIFRRQRCRRRD